MCGVRGTIRPERIPWRITTTIIRLIASIIIPPLGVFLKRGLGWSFVLSIVLTILGYIPGLLYAIWVVLFSD
ncbi:MAG: YqaE/Pmp3 family membrane protein [Thermomicrobiales bacterium]